MAKAALYWGMKPWEFRALPPEKKGELLAVHDVDKEIESYYNNEYMKKSSVNQPANKPQKRFPVSLGT